MLTVFLQISRLDTVSVVLYTMYFAYAVSIAVETSETEFGVSSARKCDLIFSSKLSSPACIPRFD